MLKRCETQSSIEGVVELDGSVLGSVTGGSWIDELPVFKHAEDIITVRAFGLLSPLEVNPPVPPPQPFSPVLQPFNGY